MKFVSDNYNQKYNKMVFILDDDLANGITVANTGRELR